MSRTMHKICLRALITFLFLLALARAQLAPNQAAKTLKFKHGQRLHLLPGAKILRPRAPVQTAAISMMAGRLQGPTNKLPLMIDFVTPVYQDRSSGRAYLFGPTLRLKGGDNLTIDLLNNLTQPGIETTASLLNSFHQPMTTNNHVHGMHSPPGVAAQAAAGNYTGGDNIFKVLPPKKNPSDQPARLEYKFQVPHDHMPGLFWYHAHAHGSTAIQVPTSSGLVIVEDNPNWLPDAAGCREVRGLLEAAPEIILHLQLLTFAAPTRSTRTGAAGGGGGGGGGGGRQPWNQQWAWDRDDPNIQIFSQLSDPANPLVLPPHTLSGTATNLDFAVLNGGYQPVISMKSGTYYRWRVAWATTKRFVILTIVDSATQLPTPNCELLLTTKDGVYLQNIPRLVDHIFLSPGNRAELLVKCTAAVGQKYILRSGGGFNPYGAECNFNTPNYFQQDTIATIRMKAGPVSTPTPQTEACMPRRPGYAADLRDESLAAAGAAGKLIEQPVTFVMGQAFGCLVNGQNFSFPDPTPIDLPLGSVVEWTMNHAAIHPMHTHINPTQLVGLPSMLLAGCNASPWFKVGDYQDTWMVPFAAQGATIRLRMQPGEFTGYSVMHCHTLGHEDLGCMKVMKFSCPGASDPHPAVCPGFAFPVPSTYV